MEIGKQFLDQVNENPLYTLLGIRIDTVENGTVRSSLKAAPGTCWPVDGQPHGGVLFTLMDTTMAWAAIVQPEVMDVTTVHLDIQYLRAARNGPWSCEARAVHRTSRTCFLRAEIRDSTGEPVAMGQGTYRTFPKASSQFT